MKVLVLGGGGMLGHKVCQVLSARGVDVAVTTRKAPSAYARIGVFDGMHAGVVHGEDPEQLSEILGRVSPDVIVNCVGIVKQLPEASRPVPAIEINSLLPHRLEALCGPRGIRLVHISTDCVFAGTRGGYVEADPPDALDLYGRTKSLGEVAGPSSLTLRTSIIGRELTGTSGLVEWFLAQDGPTVPGFPRAFFSGVTTSLLASLIADELHRVEPLQGLYHVAAERIAKLDLLRLLQRGYKRPVEVVERDGPVIDRSLDATRFWSTVRQTPPSWEQLVADLVADPTPYDDWRRTLAAP